jgi:benzoate membrane transport protein
VLRDLLRDTTPQTLGTGLLVALVGYASSVAVVVQGLAAVGASPAEIASALLLLAVSKSVLAVGLSLRMRMPVSIAWTTPGMALLAATGPVPGGFPAAVGAFLVVGLMVAAVAAVRPLGRLVEAIPKPLANGMLAGILLQLCLAPFAALGVAPGPALAVLATWVAVGRFARLWAVPAAVAVAVALTALETPFAGVAAADLLPSPVLVVPAFGWEAMAGIALPLFVVTMASQNIPGLAVLQAFGYRPPTAPLFLGTGLGSALTAPFGAPTVNLAAITAALCAGPDAHPDPGRRYAAAVWAGVGYLGFGALAGATAVLVTLSPPVLIGAVAGLALIGAFGGAVKAAVEGEGDRTPALVAFLVTASGVSALGIGSAFWGLLLGGALHAIRPRG